MNCQVSKNANQVVMEFTVPQDEFAFSLRLAGKKLGQKVNIPGFRKGHAPQSVLESFVGIQALLDEAAEEVMPRAYLEALKEHDIRPVDRPEVEITQIGKDEDFCFKATVTVIPDVTLGEYKGVKVVKQTYTITDKDVDDNLEMQRTRLGVWADEPEGQAQNRDQAEIDFTGYIDGVPFEGGHAEGYPLEIGSDAFIPGFEPQLIGMKPGEQKDISVTFPDEYHEASLAGKPATFSVTLKSLKRKMLPELTDDLAQELSETANTVAELREEVKKNLQEQSDAVARDTVRSLAINKAVENAQVDVPSVMIENRVDDYVEDFEHRISEQGLTMQMYYDYTKQTLDDLKAQYREQAAVSVRMDLVLGAVAKAEGLSATEDEINQQLDFLSTNYGQDLEQMRQQFKNPSMLANLKEGIQLVKAGDLIFDSAVIEEQQVTSLDEGEAKKPRAKKAKAKDADAKAAPAKKPRAKKVKDEVKEGE